MPVATNIKEGLILIGNLILPYLSLAN